MLIDKILPIVLFLGIAIYEKSEYYLFHIIGMVLIIIINMLLYKYDLTIILTAFTLTFAAFSMLAFNHTSELYMFSVILLLLINIFKIKEEIMPIMSRYNMLFYSGIGVTFGIAFVYILSALGAKLEYNKPKEEEKKDYTCALYKDNEFVKYV